MPNHHFAAGTMCPRGRRLFEGEGGLRERAKLVCHCVLLELPDRLVLIDTGIGVRDVEHPDRLTRTMRKLMRPTVDRDDTAIARVRALGFDPRDVRDILVTHLDYDHAGGLADFPAAKVHVYASEHAAAMERTARMGHQRYRPAQWSHGPHWVLYEPRGDAWFGFEAVRDLEGLGDDVLMLPLIGHTPGHCGVAFRDGDRWKLHAGDSYFFHGEMDVERPHCTPGLSAYQSLMDADREARLGNQDRLRKLLRDHGREVDVFCAHDPVELSRMPRPERRRPLVTEARR
ncbi:MAG: MBL fold metallo-hydrolase [Myxococcota bacterium]|nr:MBL fold metallo-hydrolase [Myxococcota bacterium]